MHELIKEFNRENLKPLVFIAIVLFLLAVTAYPQRTFSGRIVEVIDGKTAILQVSRGGKLTVVLQFIEVPEAEQPLSQIVKEHLQALILDKPAEFLPQRILTTASVGQIFVGGVDISQQMLRDGAAWYALPEKSAQNQAESQIYLSTEAQAKMEKRGVWGVENMKTPWEFRAEKEVTAQDIEKAKKEMRTRQKVFERREAVSNPTTPVKPKIQPTTSGLDMWSQVSNSAAMANTSTGTGLLTGSVPNAGIGYVMTAGNFFNFNGGNFKAKIETRSVYIYSSGEAITGNGYVIGFLTEADQFNFVDSNNLTITADKQKLNLGKAYRMFREMPYSVQEMLLYKTDAKTLSKIAGAKSLEVNIGKYSGKLEDDYQMRIKNLLAATVN